MKRSTLNKLLRGAGALLFISLISVPVLSVGANNSRTAAAVPVPGRSSFDAIVTEAEVWRGEMALRQEDALSLAQAEEDFPSVWPVRFSENGYISSFFGSRIDPVTGESSEFHAGIDLADKPNTKIHAAASGTVTEARDYGGYGLTILIDHGNGYETRYSHCNSLLVAEGDTVSQGQVIATMGATGRVTGVHCDFRVYLDGTAIDPLTVLDPEGPC